MNSALFVFPVLVKSCEGIAATRAIRENLLAECVGRARTFFPKQKNQSEASDIDPAPVELLIHVYETPVTTNYINISLFRQNRANRSNCLGSRERGKLYGEHTARTWARTAKHCDVGTTTRVTPVVKVSKNCGRWWHRTDQAVRFQIAKTRNFSFKDLFFSAGCNRLLTSSINHGVNVVQDKHMLTGRGYCLNTAPQSNAVTFQSSLMVKNHRRTCSAISEQTKT